MRPAPWPDDLLPAIRAANAASGRKVVALDDDPTGVQTVFDTAVLARWSVGDLAAELADPRPVCFVLTNSRSLAEPDAIALDREVAANLLAASRRTGRPFVVASRSDSTLRGHFPAETDALADALGGIDATLLVPAFTEGGRLTVDDVHYLRDGDRLVPVGESEFARDATFGYRASNLRDWVAEKSGGRVAAEAVRSLGLDLIRGEGPEGVAALLAGCRDGAFVVVNAETDRDLEIVARGAQIAEDADCRFLYRTGASFVRVRAGLPKRPLLTRDDLLGPGVPPGAPGLVVVGSHVRKSSEQLAHLLAQPDLGLVSVELRVPAVVDPAHRDAEVARGRDAVGAALAAGRVPVVATSRDVLLGSSPAGSLALSRDVSAAMVEVVRTFAGAPAWVVAKGGITSSDVGTRGLGARRAIVLGQALPGVPVWRLGPETRFPGIPYVVFPGNVGGPDALADVVRALLG